MVRSLRSARASPKSQSWGGGGVDAYGDVGVATDENVRRLDVTVEELGVAEREMATPAEWM